MADTHYTGTPLRILQLLLLIPVFIPVGVHYSHCSVDDRCMQNGSVDESDTPFVFAIVCRYTPKLSPEILQAPEPIR